MIATWMAWSLAVGLLLVLACAGAEAVCRATGRPTRWVWAAGMAALLVAVVVRPTHEVQVGTVRLSDGATTPAAAPASKEPPSAVVAAAVHTWSTVVGATRGALVQVQRAVPERLDRWLLPFWALLGGVALLLLVGTHWRLWQARAAWPQHPVDGQRVRVSPAWGPAAVGLLRPEVVVPEWLLSHPPELRRIALAHEAEHVRVRDPLLIAAAWAATALLAWNPAMWWMLSRLRLAVELDCDARVLRRGVAPASYGSLLIDVAGRRSGVGLAAAALVPGTFQLERRILAMTTPSKTPATRALMVAGLSLIAVVAACDAGLPTASEVDAMDAKSAAAVAGRLSLHEVDEAPSYIVDGTPVTAQEAQAIAPQDIWEINVVKGAEGTEIRVTTRHQGADGTRQMVAIREQPLVIIDGVRATEAEMKALNPDDIESVSVVKGAAATRLHEDPAAANGVITIKTKRR